MALEESVNKHTGYGLTYFCITDLRPTYGRYIYVHSSSKHIWRIWLCIQNQSCCVIISALIIVKKIKVTLVQALRLCTGRTAHRGSRGIAPHFHEHGTRRRWVVSVTHRPLFTPEKDPVPILQEAGWAPVPVWTGWENLMLVRYLKWIFLYFFCRGNLSSIRVT